MSVESILAELAHNAGRPRLTGRAILGNTIADAAQIPGQILNDRERRRIQQLQEARQAEQLGFQRADQQMQATTFGQQQAAYTAGQREQAAMNAVLRAYHEGTPNDPLSNNLEAGIMEARRQGMPHLEDALKEIDRKEKIRAQGTITQQDPTKDTYRNGVLEKKGTPKLDTSTNGLALLAQNSNPFVRTLADSALTRAQTKPAGPGTIRETSTGLVRIGDDNKVTPLGVKGYHPPAAQGSGGGAGGLDEGGLDLLATQYRIQGTSAIPTRISGEDRAKLINLAAKQAKALGNSPAQTIQKQYALKSDGAALTKITNMSAAAEAFETKAIAQAELVRGLSKKVKRTEYPIINAALQSGREATGDTDAHLFANGLLTFTTEYAKLMEGSTGSVAGSSDAARKDAARLISTALNNGTIDKTLDQMKWEMQQTRRGYDVVVDGIQRRMGGAPATTTPPPAPPPTLTANTTQRVVQNGVTYDVTTDAAGKVISSQAVKP
jgi:hypothetical protein